ncbi:hypothetical protein ACE1BM_21600, partial [Aeromonas jandaei]
AISTLNSNVSIGSSLKTASFTPGGSHLHWHVGHFCIGTNKYTLNLAMDLDTIPPLLQPLLTAAEQAGVNYILFYND